MGDTHDWFHYKWKPYKKPINPYNSLSPRSQSIRRIFDKLSAAHNNNEKHITLNVWDDIGIWSINPIKMLHSLGYEKVKMNVSDGDNNVYSW
jgi:hypothetical protein